jgi:branched-chain amino acid transport system substrate-binding protein
MRDIQPLLNACMAFALQVILSSGLSNPHPVPIAIGSYRDPQGGLLNADIKPTAEDSGGGDTIKIGLLIQDKNSTAALRAAGLAVQMANKKGGVNGLPVRLIVRSMEGPWGTGSKEAVSMIFDENVIGILGSHDGRNAHLVEQVAAKSRVVFISAWTGDPTLSEAYVPWFFNCVPNDLQQASSLTIEIYEKMKLSRIAVIFDNGYDSQSALKNFIKMSDGEGRPQPLKLPFDQTTTIPGLAAEFKSADIQGIILFVQPPLSAQIAEGLKLQHLDLPVFGAIALLDEDKISYPEMKNYERFVIVSAENLSGTEDVTFREDYKKAYGIFPGAVASYAFDGMNLLMEAIGKSGSDYENMQKALSEMRYDGVTGIIQFDKKGNRKGTPGFVEIKNGIAVHLK